MLLVKVIKERVHDVVTFIFINPTVNSNTIKTIRKDCVRVNDMHMIKIKNSIK